MYDFVHHNLPPSFDDSFHYNYEIQNLHQTRQSGQLYIPRYIYIYIYNALITYDVSFYVMNIPHRLCYRINQTSRAIFTIQGFVSIAI